MTSLIWVECLGASDGSSDVNSSLLLQNQHLESLKVGQRGSSQLGSQLLGPRGGSPLALDVGSGPLLGDSAGSGASGQVGKDDGGQNNLVQGDGLSLDLRTVNQDLLC